MSGEVEKAAEAVADKADIGAETIETSDERGNRKQLVGVVVSDKMSKTRVVKVQRLEMHRRYKKYVRRDSKFVVHDETSASKAGDKVLIMETRPLSKTKRWRLVKIIN